jgi:uncharacterized protein with NRDE domain
MCTVTYISQPNGFFLTSNRDEKKIRLQADAPKLYPFASGNMMFPKDGTTGGTWIALHENGNAMVLLNGGVVSHQYSPPYRKSRGLIFLDIFDHPQPIAAFDSISLQKIEPFTLVIRQQDLLFEARWDGSEKLMKELDPLQSYVWSSSTLYPDHVIQKRKEWFRSFLQNNSAMDQNHILNFHRFAGDGDKANDVLMNRNDELFTVSITLLHQQYGSCKMNYYDLINNEVFSQEIFQTNPVTAVNEAS